MTKITNGGIGRTRCHSLTSLFGQCRWTGRSGGRFRSLSCGRTTGRFSRLFRKGCCCFSRRKGRGRSGFLSGLLTGRGSKTEVFCFLPNCPTTFLICVGSTRTYGCGCSSRVGSRRASFCSTGSGDQKVCRNLCRTYGLGVTNAHQTGFTGQTGSVTRALFFGTTLTGRTRWSRSGRGRVTARWLFSRTRTEGRSGTWFRTGFSRYNGFRMAGICFISCGGRRWFSCTANGFGTCLSMRCLTRVFYSGLQTTTRFGLALLGVRQTFAKSAGCASWCTGLGTFLTFGRRWLTMFLSFGTTRFRRLWLTFCRLSFGLFLRFCLSWSAGICLIRFGTTMFICLTLCWKFRFSCRTAFF